MREVRCPVVIGRGEDIAVLAERLRKARGGAGGLIFVVGEAGVGKSRLVSELAGQAVKLGMRTLHGRAVDAQPAVGFRPLAEAFSSVQRSLDALAEPELAPYRRALRPIVSDAAVDRQRDHRASPIAVFEGVVRLARALAGGRGLLLVLEDLHGADADTLAILEYLADHLGGEAVLCVCTARSDQHSPAASLAEKLAARRTATRLKLERLAPSDILEMIHACLEETTVPVEVVDQVQRSADGIPFIVEELLTAVVASAREADKASMHLAASTVPRSYAEIVRSRLSLVTERARSVVNAAAVLGRTIDWSLLPPIVGLDDRTVLAELRTAGDANLVSWIGPDPSGRFEFRHALVREAILDELAPPERFALCLHAAAVIEASRPGLPGDLCELTADLRERAGDRLGAFRLVMESARRAISRTALATAESTLDRAMVLAKGDPWLEMGAGLLQTDVLSMTGKLDRLRALGETLPPAIERRLSMGTPDRLALIHLRLAQGILEAGDTTLARNHLDSASRLAQDADDAVLGAEIQALAARLELATGNLAAASALADAVLQRGTQLDLPDVTCAALQVQAGIALRRGDVKGTIARLEQGRAIADGANLTVWRAHLLLDHAAVDEITTADVRRAALARQLAADAGAIALEANADLQLGRLLLARYEVEAAEPAIDRSIDVSRRYGLAVLPGALTTRAVLLARTGRSQELPDAIRAIGSIPGSDADQEAIVQGEVRATAYLLAEDRSKALTALERAMESAPAGAARWAYPGLWGLLRAVTDETPSRRGLSVLGATTTHRAIEAFVWLADAVVLGRQGQTAQAADAFARADQVLSVFPFHRQIGRRLVGPAAIADGWGEPARWLREALAFFDAPGHGRVAAAIRGLLRRAGESLPRRARGKPPVPAELRPFGITSREADVLALAADGLSYAEMATRLYLSPRTVQSHMISLLAKLGLESKAQLASFASRSGVPVAPLDLPASNSDQAGSQVVRPGR